MTAISPRAWARAVLVTTATASLAVFSVGVASADPGLDRVRDRVTSVSERVDDLYHEAEVANERLLAAKVEHEAASKALKTSTQTVRKQTAQLNDLTMQLGGFAAAAYRQGVVDPTLHLVLSDNPAEALGESMMLDAYAEQQTSGLAVVASKRDALLAKQADMAEQAAMLSSIETTIADEQKALDAKVAEAERLLASLEAQERRILERIEAQRAERAAEQAARAEARTALADAADADSGPSGVPDAEVSAPAATPASGRGAAAVAFAMSQIGDAYAYGGTGPSAWDCSGLTGGAWAAAGVSVPRTSQAQFAALPRVSMNALRPGDIVGYYGGVSHVGIYIGNGQIVHASRPGRPVAVVPLHSMPVAGAVRPG